MPSFVGRHVGFRIEPSCLPQLATDVPKNGYKPLEPTAERKTPEKQGQNNREKIRTIRRRSGSNQSEITSSMKWISIDRKRLTALHLR